MNKVFLIGNLTRDPELTETTSGVKICRFTIAVNRNYTSADGERKTDFFNIVAWRGHGETAARYLRKGNKVAVNGSIELRNYEDREGIKRTGVDIIASDLEFLTQKRDENEEPAGYTSLQTPTGKKPILESFDDDGDIPF